MAKDQLGGGLFAAVPLQAGEQELARFNVNYTQSARRAVGGRLFVSTQRLVFCPHRLDAATGGETWALPRSAVTQVGVRPKGGDTFGGGLRDRLAIGVAEGSELLFVVNRLPSVAAELAGLLDLPGGAV